MNNYLSYLLMIKLEEKEAEFDLQCEGRNERWFEDRFF